ncbi:MAG: PP2C family protein-serine/threonine phosphatase [Phycisphaerae bacterium]|nr:PP2C family protein-serine/threonine phosphatase [Phycisphaerae bacterium]
MTAFRTDNPDADAGPIVRLAEIEPAKISATHLASLMELGRQLASIDDRAARHEALCRVLADEQFHAFSVARLSVTRTDGRVAFDVLTLAGSAEAGEPLHVSRSLLAAALDCGQPAMAGNAENSAAAVACPLAASPGRADVLYVTLPPAFANGEWLSLIGLAAQHYVQAEAAWAARRQAEAHAAIEHELAHARRIQMELIPRQVVAPGLEIAIGYEPCRWVGGDYVDVVPSPDGRTLLIVADVCGKGLPAALVSTSLQAIIHTNFPRTAGLADLLAAVNDYLCDRLTEGSFVTLMAGLVDPKANRLSCMSAGHPLPFLLGADGRLSQPQINRHPPLGIVPIRFEADDIELAPGQLLAMFTDGLTDVADANRQMLGAKRLGEFLRNACAQDRAAGIEAIAGSFSAAVDAFRGGGLPTDDRSFLLVRRTESGRPA